MYMYLYILECFSSSIILFVNWLSWFKFVCYNCSWIISSNNFISPFISIHAFTADTYLTSTDESAVQDCFVVDRDYTSAYFLISRYCHLSTFLFLHILAGWKSNSFEMNSAIFDPGISWPGGENVSVEPKVKPIILSK